MKKNSKGFSLVELIVVIAVMAVLVVVLAPAYLRYVDKTRLQKDISALSEVAEAVKIAAAEEKVAEEIPDDLEENNKDWWDTVVVVSGTDNGGDGTITVTNVTKSNSCPDANDLKQEVLDTVGEKIDLKNPIIKAKGLEFYVRRNADYVLLVEAELFDYMNDENAQEEYQKLREAFPVYISEEKVAKKVWDDFTQTVRDSYNTAKSNAEKYAEEHRQELEDNAATNAASVYDALHPCGTGNNAEREQAMADARESAVQDYIDSQATAAGLGTIANELLTNKELQEGLGNYTDAYGEDLLNSIINGN